MSRSVRLETRSRARDELRKAMNSIDKVKKWEKKWVPVGGNACKLQVFKWVPKETVDQNKDQKKESTDAKTNEENTTTTNITEMTSQEKEVVKEPFPSNQFLQNGNEDSRDSFTASTAELMKYCPDNDSQDSITESDYTATMSDQLEDSTKLNSKSSTPTPNESSSNSNNTTPANSTPQPDPTITVSDAFKDNKEPTAPTLPENKVEEQPTIAELSQATTAELPQPTAEELPQATTAELPQPTAEELPQPTAAELLQPTTTEEPQPMIVELTPPTITELPKTTTPELPQPTAEELPEPATAELPEPATAELPEPTTTEPEEETKQTCAEEESNEEEPPTKKLKES